MKKSGFNPHSYFLVAGISAISVLMLAALLSVGTKWLGRNPLPYEQILHYQIAKIGAAEPDIVFLGDSSLGNAIDADYWSEISGGKALNLALTGAYGYESSYLMLQRVIDHSTPDTVIIMQAADMMMRPPAPDALLAAVGKPDFTWDWLVTWWTLNMNWQEMVSALKFLHERGAEIFQATTRAQFNIVNDYIPQGRKFVIDETRSGFAASSILPEKAADLSKIVSLCEDMKILCVYMHGPLAYPICERSDEYFSRVNEIIQSKGILIANDKSPCMSELEVGDTINHVGSSHKRTFTDLYFENYKSMSLNGKL